MLLGYLGGAETEIRRLTGLRVEPSSPGRAWGKFLELFHVFQGAARHWRPLPPGSFWSSFGVCIPGAELMINKSSVRLAWGMAKWKWLVIQTLHPTGVSASPSWKMLHTETHSPAVTHGWIWGENALCNVFGSGLHRNVDCFQTYSAKHQGSFVCCESSSLTIFASHRSVFMCESGMKLGCNNSRFSFANSASQTLDKDA